MTTTLTRENTANVLIAMVKAGQKTGAFLLQETVLLKKACDYFIKDQKPDMGENPEITAVNLLLQACQKINGSPNNPFTLEDASLIYEIFEFWEKEVKKPTAKTAGSLGGVEEVVDEEEEEEEEAEKPSTKSSQKNRLLSLKVPK